MGQNSSTPQPTSQEPERKKKNKLIWIIVAILAVLMICGVITLVVGFIAFRNYNDFTDDDQQEEQEDSDQEENEQEVVIDEEPELLTYTHPDYPNLKIYYYSDWDIEDSQVDNEYSEVAKDTTVIFSKDGYEVTYNFYAMLAFGGVPVCYETGVENLFHLEDTWYREVTETGYFYLRGVYVKDVSYIGGTDFDSFFGPSGFYSEADSDDYEYCSYDVDIGGTITTYPLPVDYSPEGGTYYAYITISLDITGPEDQDLLDEADEMVVGSQL